jgi:hypothetical protein
MRKKYLTRDRQSSRKRKALFFEKKKQKDYAEPIGA